MSAVNTFDRIAPVYDFLHHVVFGDALDKSQRNFLGSIENGSKVLMIGGGTGRALDALLTATEGCKVWYVEASSEMIARAKRRIKDRVSNVIFIHGDEHSIPDNLVFDVAITGFFLDLFPDAKVGELASKIRNHLHEDGLWLITDFVDTGKWWQRILLWTMYRFFIITCGIEGRRLPRWEDRVASSGLSERASKLYFGDFIKSSVWLKTSSQIYA